MQKPFFKFTEAINDNGTVWYTIQVHAKGQDPEPIIFKERYSELRQIHERCMETKFRNDLPEFPAKKFFGTTKEDFIQKRKKELENYYNTLSKTVKIEELTELNKFIQSHRKKKIESKPSKPIDQTPNHLQSKTKKQAQLKTSFQKIYKQVCTQIIDLHSDFCAIPELPNDESSKKLIQELHQTKAQESKLLARLPEGVEENETDFWSMFLRDEHEEFLARGGRVMGRFNEIEKELGGVGRENIVIAK